MARAPAPRALPRLSASQLADYLVAATPVGQMGILRQAKNPGPNRPLIIQYQHARRTIAECLRDRSNLNRISARSIVDLEDRRDNANHGPLVRDDAQRCIDVIEAFQRATNELDLWGTEYREPQLPSPTLNIAGVEISVSPDVVALSRGRTDDRVGQAFIRCTIGTPGDAAENRRAEANGHLATIAHLHTAQYLAYLGTPHAPTSMVIDVPRRAVVRGPVNSARRIANIEAACAMIAAVWPVV
ncbi:hypothetical protein GGR46_002068 [Sphingomonas kyeonggiensis]|uniref:Uncharacterized protein n=1 Tax=Sphingomonas kyeonggiensis TaxID=1268553 RepID=A0A7W6JRZ4_9SPHN|nr:hypothetical protein [Sphingomonas kyeonggiensis]